MTVVQPGAGINADPSTLDTKAVAQYTTSGEHLSTVDFIMNIIPDQMVNAFAKGEILQILLIAIMFGMALATFDKGKPVLDAFHYISHILFKMIGFIMYAAPLGAFGAMAFTIGRYGVRTLLQLGEPDAVLLRDRGAVCIRGAGGDCARCTDSASGNC